MLKLLILLYFGLLALTMFLGYATHSLDKKHPKIWLAVFLGMIGLNDWLIANFLDLPTLVAWICLTLATISFILAFMVGDIRATLEKR